MPGLLFWGIFAVGVAVVIGAIIFYGSIIRRGHRLGTKGFVQRSRLNCPHCGQTFDYDWVPGVALTAVRLGKSRYMACPLCHKWSMFNVYDTMIPRPSDGSTPTSPPSGP